jgi:hypothetical protein
MYEVWAVAVKEIFDEDFQDYKKASMLLAMPRCDFKCFTELSLKPGLCQNFDVVKKANIIVSFGRIFDRYINNKITNAIIFGGLEPFLDFESVLGLVKYFRFNKVEDDFVIYSGYYPNEVMEEIEELRKYKNVIVKFGRYVPNLEARFDEVLGVTLASQNQFAIKIS